MSEPLPQPKAVNLVDQSTGQVVNVNESDLGSVGEGYRLATPEEVQADIERQQYGEGLGNELAAGAEGALSGATLGLSDVAAKAISPEYAEGLAKRREYNPTSAAIGEGAGIIGATLLTGGLEGAAAGGLEAGRLGLGAARAATAPVRALTGLGEAVTSGAGRLLGTEAATGVLGKAAREAVAYGAGGGAEGALFGAAKVATDDFLNDHEITAERILAGAGQGALTGAMLGAGVGGGAALLREGADVVWPKLKKALDAEAIDDFVGERAYKAALGGRNLRDVQRSERIGGPAEVGETLLREGVVTPTSTIDDIAKAAEAKAAEKGARIGELVDELDAPADGLGSLTAVKPSGDDLMRRIRSEVIEPLKSSPVKRDIGEAVEQKFKYLEEALTRQDAPPLKFRDLWELRRDLDDRLKWEQAPAPFAAPNPTLEAMRDVRREMETYWQEASEVAAESSGREGFLAEFRQAKRDYSHLKHAEEISTKAIARDSANRMLSPSDYGFGAVVAGADAITGGGASLGTLAYGLASGAVHKFFRERGNAMFAGSMYQLRNAPKLVRDARAGEQAVESAGRGFVAKVIERAKYAAKHAPEAAIAASARAMASPESYERAVRTASELADPSSKRRQEMRREAAALRVHYPALANAMEAKAQTVGDFLASKAGPLSATPKAADPFGHLRKPRHDPAKAQKLARYADAATNPKGALDRIAKGEFLREDVETLQTLYPRMFQRVRDEVLMNLSKVDELPTYEARVRLSRLLGMPMDPSMRPERIAAMQQVIKSGAYGEAQAQQNGELAPSQRRPPKISNLYETRAERAQNL